MPLVLSPLLDPREHGRIPQHVWHDTKHNLVPANVELLQGACLPPDVGLHTVLGALLGVEGVAVAVKSRSGIQQVTKVILPSSVYADFGTKRFKFVCSFICCVHLIRSACPICSLQQGHQVGALNGPGVGGWKELRPTKF